MRRDEVKAAFIEGARLAYEDEGHLDAETLKQLWAKSDARKQLEKPLAD